MFLRRILGFLFLSCIFAIAVAQARETGSETIPNWEAPAFWSPSEGLRTAGGGIHRLQVQAISPGAYPFIAIAPCRQYNSLSFTPLAQGVNRAVTLTGAPCGIPTSAVAASVNITVFNITGATGNGVFKVDAATPPAVAWINYPPSEAQRGNAGVVALNGSGQIIVQVAQGAGQVDFVVDVNGYYGSRTADSSNVFLGPNAGNSTMSASGFGGNTGIGASALNGDTGGFWNTAIGGGALQTNSSGNNNTATGFGALSANDTGGANTASGVSALGANVGGSFNTAFGLFALESNTSGSHNTALGKDAGMNLTTGDDNIDIGNPGNAGEATTIRIGIQGTQTATFIAGISGATVVGTNVVVNSTGQLGTAGISSARFKDDIRDIGEESERLLKLRPVSFRYKPELDPECLPQYGLVAEEVAKVYPDLVLSDQQGNPKIVRYDLVNTLLLNEVQKQHRTIEEQTGQIKDLEARLAALEERSREERSGAGK